MSKERLAKIRITKRLLLECIGFLPDAEIKECRVCDYPFHKSIEFLVSHPELPIVEKKETGTY